MNYLEIANRIRQIRIEKSGDKHGAVKAFAEFLGVNYTTYVNYEKGRVSPEFLLLLHERLGVSIDWLLAGEEKAATTPEPLQYTTAPTSIGERLRVLREEKLSFSREAFAEKVGWPVDELDRYEKGEAEPSEERLVKVWLAFSKEIGIEGFEWLRTGTQREAAEEEPAYNVVPLATPEEQAYLEKLLRALRNPATKKAAQHSIDTLLLVEQPGPLEDEEKKGGKAS